MPCRLVYFFVYTVRVKRMTFGLGPLFDLIGKGMDAVKGLFTRWKSGEEGKQAA